MVRLIKILCWFRFPDFKWIESENKYKRAYTDDWGNNWMEQDPQFWLDFGLKEDLYNSYSSWVVKRYHPNYRLEAHWWIMKMVYFDRWL